MVQSLGEEIYLEQIGKIIRSGKVENLSYEPQGTIVPIENIPAESANNLRSVASSIGNGPRIS